jgi:hypothetical protein
MVGLVVNHNREVWLQRRKNMGSRLMRTGGYGLGVLIAMFSVAAHVMAQAQAAPVPEIDGASIVSGVGLLSAAVLILKSRWK